MTAKKNKLKTISDKTSTDNDTKINHINTSKNSNTKKIEQLETRIHENDILIAKTLENEKMNEENQ